MACKLVGFELEASRILVEAETAHSPRPGSLLGHRHSLAQMVVWVASKVQRQTVLLPSGIKASSA